MTEPVSNIQPTEEEAQLAYIGECFKNASKTRRTLASRVELAERAMKMYLLATPEHKVPVDVSLAEAAQDPHLALVYGSGRVELVWLKGDYYVPYAKREEACK